MFIDNIVSGKRLSKASRLALNPGLTFLCTVWFGENNIFPWASVSYTCVKEKDWELTHWHVNDRRQYM